MQKEEEKRKAAEEKLIMSGIIENIIKIQQTSDKDSTEEEVEIDEDTSIIQRVLDFIQQEVPSANLIREFNGNFVY
jgi:hypothetical protein